jgi:hypothetical protein
MNVSFLRRTSDMTPADDSMIGRETVPMTRASLVAHPANDLQLHSDTMIQEMQVSSEVLRTVIVSTIAPSDRPQILEAVHSQQIATITHLE